ncbi:MAG: non-canonical purine NTP pyrophosphatase, partial [Caldisericia bacterium]|nr:non-canonical purine NTP pyrophosphatase [Caldisericia bacterium]
MKLLIASNNQHKYQELSPSFQSIGIDCVMPVELQLSLPQEVECYSTYQENAKAKVEHFLHVEVDGVLGDDSGLEVKALNRLPGIHSARFAGTGRE